MSSARQAQIGGEIGPFLDTVQQRQVSVVVLARCKYVSGVSPTSTAQYEGQVQAAMLSAIRDTIAPRMASGQISFKDLGTNNVDGLIPEIFARSGLGQAGISVDKLVMRFGIDGREPPPLPTGQPQGAAPPAMTVPANVAPVVDLAKGAAPAKAKSGASGVVIGIALVLIVAAVAAFALLYHRGPSGASAPPPAKGSHAPAKK